MAMEKKPSTFSFLFKRLKKIKSNGGGSGGGGRWKAKRSTGIRWKRKFNLHNWFVDTLIFKIVSIFEAIVLVSKLCFFFFCCGCRL